MKWYDKARDAAIKGTIKASDIANSMSIQASEIAGSTILGANRDLPLALKILETDDWARMHLADAIAEAYRAADDDTTWNSILMSAILHLKETPAGQGKA